MIHGAIAIPFVMFFLTHSYCARSFRAATIYFHHPRVTLHRKSYGTLFSSTLTNENVACESNSRREDEEEVLMQEEDFRSLPEGTPKGFYVVKQYEMDSEFDWSPLNLTAADISRLGLSPSNISLPIALLLADNDAYPTMSRARKACRKGNILIHRGPLAADESGHKEFMTDRCIRGRVGDRIMVGDVVGKQVRMGSGYFPVLSYKKPPFEVPVVYEDDYCAIVNKPSGIVVYQHRSGGHGTMTIRAALPFVLTPPSAGTYSVMRRPASVHRLDKPTSGVLCVAKTKPALVSLSRQFHDRIVKKTYHAIVNGLPACDTTISSQEAYELGVDVDPSDQESWYLIDYPLDEKYACTVWRPLRYVKSLHANDGLLTLVEMKPKTGRYHQLRRHMAWACDRPLVGDAEYDGGTESAMNFRQRGLFLCSTRVTMEHPFYNTPSGRKEWEVLDNERKIAGRALRLAGGKVMLSAEVDLPDKFESLLRHEAERYEKFESQPN